MRLSSPFSLVSVGVMAAGFSLNRQSSNDHQIRRKRKKLAVEAHFQPVPTHVEWGETSVIK